MDNRLFSVMADYIGLYMLHQKKSKQYHYSHKLGEFGHLMSMVQGEIEIPELTCTKFEHSSSSYEQGKYYFRSLIQSGFPINDQASGISYTCPSDEPVHVIIVHGWRMSSHDRIYRIFLDSLMQRNYQLYFPYLPYHFDRAPQEMAFNGEYLVSANVDRTIEGVWQAIADLKVLIRSIKGKKPGKIIVIGVSLGGYFTNLLAAFDKNIDLLISVMYANSLAHSVYHTIPGRYIRKDFIRHGFTSGQLSEAWQGIEPANYIPLLERDRILLLSGRYDQYVDFMDSERLYEAWGHPNRLVYNCAHSGLVFKKKEILADVLDFIDKHK
jgi:hypothetical protein